MLLAENGHKKAQTEKTIGAINQTQLMKADLD